MLDEAVDSGEIHYHVTLSTEFMGRRCNNNAPHAQETIRSHILLIYSDHSTSFSTDANTEISSLAAISYAIQKGDPFTQYETVCDETNTFKVRHKEKEPGEDHE